MASVTFQDAIGDRLDHPENVPAHLRHLIPDDQQRVKRLLDMPVSGRVLDVGCSDGAITKRLQEAYPTAHISGADIAPRSPLHYQWDVRTHFTHPIGPFDTIYCCEVFEHLTDTDAMTARDNILDVLKPGGDLIVTVPNRYPHDNYEVGCRSRWAWPDHRSSWKVTKLGHFLGPHFQKLAPVPLYPGERYHDSIWLIVRCKSKK